MDSSGQAGIDLHIHSTASDGTLTPREIISLAVDLQLGAVAITDHDTVEGARVALTLATPPTCRIVSGVEISAAPFFDNTPDSSYHILGYFMDLEDPALNRLLTQLQNARSDRNPKIIEKLKSAGVDISLDEVRAAAAGAQMGRPHIAQVLLDKGYAESIDHAFDTLLRKGRPAYVDKFRVSCLEAIDVISSAGGIPVLAHPGLLSLSADDKLETLVVALKAAGLMGLEVIYPEHSAEQVIRFSELAATHDLLVTGGTDFHGELKPEITMGSGEGSLFVPFELFEALRDRKNRLAGSQAYKAQEALGYTFQRPELLQEALSHSSFVNELADDSRRDNERFEFLGDAVLNLVVGDLLMQFDPEMREGDLTRIRSAMVNEQQLADLSRTLDLGRHILLGKGESRTGGNDKSSILADSLEAVIAAIYLDGGFPAAFDFIQRHFTPLIPPLAGNVNAQDYKSELQEFIQSRHQAGPVYTLYAESGPDHDKTFRFQLETGGIRTLGIGKSKKAAEQDAARIALQILRRDNSKP